MEAQKYKDIDVMKKDHIQGCVLKNRFTIGKFIDSGSNGSVYAVVDKEDPSTRLVVKLDSQYKSFAQEIKIMRRIGQ